MADADVIIKADLKEEDLTSKIEELVQNVDDKFREMASKVQTSVESVKTSIRSIKDTAKSNVSQIKQAFEQLGTTFDQFAKAMQRAAAAASGANSRVGSSGTGATGGIGGANQPNGTPQTISELKQLINEQQKYIENLQIGTRLLQQEVDKLSQTKQLYKQITTDSAKLRQQAIGTQLKNINSIVPTNVADAERKLRRLQGLYASLERGMQRLGVTKFDILPESMWNRIESSIKRTEKQLDRLKQKAAKPIMPQDMAGVMGMSEKTLDQIAFKMKAISELRAKTPIGSTDISRLNSEYARLSKLQTEVLGKNAALVESNNALGRAFNYIRNRLAFTLTIGAFTGFVRQLYEIRGQYELLERSLGVLLNSFSKGSQIFNELNAMAIKSPFTLIELGTAAKQLTAYNFTANEVVNTTKRLADISAALGVPMERLVYNLGQIRAQTVLTARDARDFANAGLAIVPELSKYYTELEGKVVSTADVFDRMKKKAVSYNDVMAVLNKVTDEGGKFFDFQAKQAGTLKVQMANLNLAWNNMLNDMGKTHQNFLSTPLQAMRQMFLHWKSISTIITSVVAGFGAYKASQIAVSRVMGVSNTQLKAMIDLEQRSTISKYERISATRALTSVEQAEYNAARMKLGNSKALTAADYELALIEKNLTATQAMQLVTLNRNNTALHQALVNTGLLTQAQIQQAKTLGFWGLAMRRVGNSIYALERSLKALATNPMTWIMVAASLIAEISNTFNEASEQAKQFAKSVRDSAKESAENVSDLIDSYSDLRKRLEENNAKSSTVSEEESKKAWEELRVQITTASAASDIFINKLASIKDINERLRTTFDYLDTIKAVSAALENVSTKTFDIQRDWSAAWNLNLLPDGFYETLQKYSDAQEEFYKQTNASIVITNDYDNAIKDAIKTNANLDASLQKVYDSMMKFANEKGWTNNVEAINEYFSRIGQLMINEGLENGWEPEQVFQFQLKWEEQRSKAAKLALEGRINEEAKAYSQAEDDKTKKAIKAQYDRDKAQLDSWEQNNGRGRVIWSEFTKWMNDEHSSEMLKMYNKMTENGTKAIDYSSKEWVAFVNKMSDKFAKEHKLSQDDVFKHLRNWVNDANNWDVFISLTISTEGKDIYETLTEADKAANDAYSKVKRLGQEVDRLRSKKKKSKDVVEISFLDKEIEDTLKEQRKAQEEYNDAVKKGGRSSAAASDAKKRLTAATKAHNAAIREQKQAESELQKILREEIQLVNEAQKSYKDLTKAGFSRQDALKLSTSGFDESIKKINNVFKKWGIEAFDLSKYAGVSNPREILDLLQSQLDKLLASGKAKPEEVKELEVKIKELKIDAEKYDRSKIIDGLNSELGKIKEEYELAVELDANPELGNMFVDMFGIDTDALPHSFGEAFDRANKVVIEKLKAMKLDVSKFDLMSTDIVKFGESQGFGFDSKTIQNLLANQKTWRDMFKKNITDTERALDDYVKKYGNYSDKIAEIESNRLEKIKKLNNAYYKQSMRDTTAYRAKLNAINQGAQREKGAAQFDEFKNSRLYIAMFENLKFVSTDVLLKIREKLVDLRNEMGTLSPEQLKQVVQQFEKIDTELVRRNPFGQLIKNARDYQKAIGKQGKDAERSFVAAQENYDAQMRIVTMLKEQLEQKKAITPQDAKGIERLEQVVELEEEKLEDLKEELRVAQELNDKYNLMKKAFTDQWQAIGKIAQVVGANLKSLGELRDTLEKTFGIDLGNNINGVIDGLVGVGDSMNQIVSSATSGNVFGVITGTVNLFSGIGDAIASIFGDGAARTRRINKEIKNSQEEVRKLNMAYKDLERTVTAAMGSQETAAQRALIANKKAELAELERQLALEKSKRSKDRDEDAIKQYEETIQSLKFEIEDLGNSITENLLGSNVKAAAEEFVDTWVSAWKQGENTLDAIEEKMDDVVYNLIKKALASKIVGTLLQPFYDAVDQFASETSEGGVELTLNELRQLSEMANTLGININDALGALFGNLQSLGIVDNNAKNAELSALQQGIQGITEDTASALEAYMNGVSQQVYYQSDILTQIRDILINFGGDVTIATNAQILFELQQSYQVQMSIQSILQGWSNPSGLAMRVELVS